MTKKTFSTLLYALTFSIGSVCAQTIGTSPVKIPMLLSANFGELRSNHFHSGIDIKIQGKVGLPLYSFDDGYISRISVSSTGYGKALYITHPNGYTTVYGHMDGFFDEAAEYLKKYQYENKTFEANLYLPENKISVRKGQFIGYGGNTGSSFGPHLHFEIRDTKTEEALNPFAFTAKYLTDTHPPQIREIMIVPLNNAGVAGGSYSKKKYPLVTDKKTGIKSIAEEMTAWGEIGLAVMANDYMNDVSNIFGVYDISLKVDDVQLFGSRMDKFSFDETRYINSFIDYEEYGKNNAFYMRSYVEPGNKLGIYTKLINGGIINIKEERDYKLTYTLTDYFGNRTFFDFVIQGKKEESIPRIEEGETIRMFYDRENKYVTNSIEFTIPEGYLYSDLNFKSNIKNSMECISPVYVLHERNVVPLHGYCPLKIKVPANMLSDISKYYIAAITGNRKTYCKSEYKNGWFETQIRNFGDYAVVSDFTPPVIAPLLPKKWGINGKINCKISDKDSGIKSYLAEIDGKFFLLEYDAKNNLLSGNLDASQIRKDAEHVFRLVVTDNCGNKAEYMYII